MSCSTYHASTVAEVRAAVELLPTKHDQMVVGLQNNISEAVLNFDAQLRKEIDVVMIEVDKKLQEQFATTAPDHRDLQQAVRVQRQVLLLRMRWVASWPTSAR